MPTCDMRLSPRAFDQHCGTLRLKAPAPELPTQACCATEPGMLGDTLPHTATRAPPRSAPLFLDLLEPVRVSGSPPCRIRGGTRLGRAPGPTGPAQLRRRVWTLAVQPEERLTAGAGCSRGGR